MRARSIVCLAGLGMVLLVAAGVVAAHSLLRPWRGDPGGVELHWLQSITAAVPDGAEITSQTSIPSRWADHGCPPGWDYVWVNVDFSSALPTPDVVDHIDRTLVADGWRRDSRTTARMHRWTRPSKGSAPEQIILYRPRDDPWQYPPNPAPPAEVSGPAGWVLNASAPPTDGPAAGVCDG